MAEKAKSVLITHGGRAVTREELDLIEPPAASRTHFPVKHSVVIDTVSAVLTDAGFVIRSTQLAVARSDARLFATVDLQSQLAAGVSLAIGVRSSYDKSLPLGFIGGSRTFVCCNLAFRSDLSLKRKHTRHGQTRFLEAIALAIRNLKSFSDHEAARIFRLQRTELGVVLAESMILKSFERGIISHRVLPNVIREYRSPSYPEFREPTAWNLFQAFTTVLGAREKSNPQLHAALTVQLAAMFDELLNIEPFVLSNDDEVQTDEAAS